MAEKPAWATFSAVAVAGGTVLRLVGQRRAAGALLLATGFGYLGVWAARNNDDDWRRLDLSQFNRGDAQQLLFHGMLAVAGWRMSRCNAGLGQFKDSPDRMRAAIAYLRKDTTSELFR